MSEAAANRLIHERSPYLLQHAHNPVDWYPWGEEALGRARAENKPILLSIGYAACHWCHVMERESFENDAIAALMNERFISIKVDREERPDLDHIYQTVGSMLTGQGGWPLTMFLTPDLEPFYGGTYFPPEDRYGRPGFPRLLVAVSEHYKSEPEKVRKAVTEIGGALRQLNEPGLGAGTLSSDLLERGASGLSRSFDRRNGGFGGAPKFPNTMGLELFLRQWHASGDGAYLDMVTLTLTKMAESGTYDQLGGGFHRYSTDAAWAVPHFEKMLYDNALLARLYVQAFQATGDVFFERIARETLDYVLREMTSPEGGFYSTQDADTEGEEGKFFSWTPAQIKGALGDDRGKLACDYYGVTAAGNFEHGATVLHIATSMPALAKKAGRPAAELEADMAKAREILRQRREERAHPFLDDKILTGWNGLMISAFAEAGKVLGESRYTDAARRAAGFVNENLLQEGRLLRSYRSGVAGGEGFLEDYAFYVASLLDLFEGLPDPEPLRRATVLAETMIELFRDEDTGDFFLTHSSVPSLIVRPRQNADQSIPSGVANAAMDLLRLSALLDRPEWREMAHQIFLANARDMEGNPHAMGSLIGAFDCYLNGPVEVVVRAATGAESTRAGIQSLYRAYLPNKVVVLTPPDTDSAPVAAGKTAIGGEMTAYVCRDFTCSAPMVTWDVLRVALGIG